LISFIEWTAKRELDDSGNNEAFDNLKRLNQVRLVILPFKDHTDLTFQPVMAGERTALSTDTITTDGR